MPNMLSYLLGLGADPNCLDSYGRMPLFYAAKNANLATVALLLEHKANPGHPDNNRQTPVFAACVAGKQGMLNESMAVLHMLLDAGAACDEKDINGDTPLIFAVRATVPEACRRLLAAGASRTHPQILAQCRKDRGEVGIDPILEVFNE